MALQEQLKDQQQRISTLEYENKGLKEKLEAKDKEIAELKKINEGLKKDLRNVKK